MDAALKLKVEQLATDIAAQAQTLDDLNGLFRSLMKSALERMLDTKMDVHLGRKHLPTLVPEPDPISDSSTPKNGDYSNLKNRRNGHSTKTVHGDLGELALDI